MEHDPLRNPPPNPLDIWVKIAVETTEMMWASTQVIGHRTKQFSGGTLPHVHDREEFIPMGREKLEAMAESVAAMSPGAAAMNMQLGSMFFKQWMNATTAMVQLATSRSAECSLGLQTQLVQDNVRQSVLAASRLSNGVARLAHKGLQPVYARATQNAARLRKH